MDENYILDMFLQDWSFLKREDIESFWKVDNGIYIFQTKNSGVYEYDSIQRATLCSDTLDEIRAFHMGFDEKSFSAELGRRLLHKMEETGVSAARLSELTGISLAQLYNYINGLTNPTAYRVAVIEKQLGCKPGYLNPFNAKI